MDVHSAIAPHIFKYVSDTDTLKFRQVSQLWNKTFHLTTLHRFTVNIDGSSAEELEDVLFRLTFITDGIWKKFSLRNIKYDANSSNGNLLQAFFRKYRYFMVSVRLENCRIQMGQFIKLFSIPVNLSELRIINSNGMFSGGLEVLYVEDYMVRFTANMKKLQRLELRDTQVQHNPLENWLKYSVGLIELRSEMIPFIGHVLKPRSLSDIFYQNYLTLKILSLSYVVLDSVLIEMSMLGLNHLRLEKCYIPNPISFLKFLTSQSFSIETLEFVQIKLKNLCFSEVYHLQTLKTLSFENCDYDPSVLSPFSVVKTLIKIVFIGKPEDQPEVENLLRRPTPSQSLKSLVLHVGEGSENLLAMVETNFPSLEELDMSGIGDLEAENLSRIRNLQNLKCLILKGCNFGEFCHLGTFNDLEALQKLDLSDSNASDILVNSLLRSKHLTHVVLRNTHITSTCLELIIHHFGEQLMKLDVRDCEECIITEEVFEECQRYLCLKEYDDPEFDEYDSDEAKDITDESNLETEDYMYTIMEAVQANPTAFPTFHIETKNPDPEDFEEIVSYFTNESDSESEDGQS